MNLIMAIKLSIKGILSSKGRSFLTMLGIIIGVSSVIILVSIAQGTTQSITSSIEGMGSNLININITGRRYLDYKEMETLKAFPGISQIAPVVSGNVTAKYGTNSMNINIQGADENYGTVRNHGVQSGRFILPLDVEYRQKVALLGSEVVTELYGFQNPIGGTIQLNGTNFTVVGVLEEKGSTMGGSSDETILIPISTAQRFLSSTGIRAIYIQAESADRVETVMGRLDSYLLKKFNDENSYRVFNQTEMLSTLNDVTSSLSLMLGSIAGISLLVGGIGVMNIMLVSVGERTREIGIRKAIGAKRKDILSQFIIEALVISGIGGLLGIVLGFAGISIVTSFMNMSAKVSPAVLLLSFSFSLIIGLFFGIYPANKAAKLKPVDALRFE